MGIEIEHWAEMGQKHKSDVSGVILFSSLISLNVLNKSTNNNCSNLFLKHLNQGSETMLS